MSFGGSVGDIFTVGQFAWNVYKACKGASSEFEEISREVSTLHTAIKELQDEVENKDSILNRAGSSKKKELEDLVRHCRTVLQQLQRLVTRYKSLGTDSERAWDRIKFGTEGVQDIREKLTFHTSAIQLFLTTLGTGSLGRIEKKLESIIEEIRSGKREPSIVTTSGDYYDAEAEVQWDALKSELVEDGFTKQDVESHKHSIMAHLQQLIDNGKLQESVPQTKKRNPNFTSSRKRQETKTQQSNYQHPDVREDDSGSGPEDDDFSSGSEVSAVSVHNSSTADINRARLIPTIDPTNQHANRVSKDDAENLSPLKSGADSPSTREPEILAPQENKGLETEGWVPSSVDPSSFKRKTSIIGQGPGIRQNQLSSNPHPVVRNVASPPPQHPHPPLSDSDDSDDETLESDRAYYRKSFGHSRDNDFFQKGWTPHRGPTGWDFLNPGNSFAGFPRSGRDRLPEAKIVENPLPLSLEELFAGTKKKMRISRRLSDKPGDERREERILEMDIKPGLEAGSEFRFKGVGDLENGQYQDIHFIVTEKPHPVFTRDQHDIHATVELSLEDALTGWSRTFGTIDGKYVSVSVAGPTSPGYQVTFPGLGMPKSRSPGEKGYFIVTIEVKFPSSLSTKGRQLIRQAFLVDETQTAAIHNIQTTSSRQEYVH